MQQANIPQRPGRIPCKRIVIKRIKPQSENYKNLYGEELCVGYQQMRKRRRAQALEPPGLRDFPQQKQRLALMIRTWLIKRRRNAPAP